MYPFLKQAQGPHRTSLSFFSGLLDYCFSEKSLQVIRIIHAQLVKGLLKSGQFEAANCLFDKMPVRDVVSWNTMISGYASYGFVNYALGLFLQMQNIWVRPNGYTFSILMSLVSCVYHGKQIHGSMIRSGADLSNVVIGNSLINMYGKLGLVDYTFGVVLTMKELDVISWNSLIWGCHRAGCQELALAQFYRMRTMKQLPDQFTISIVVSVCSNLRALNKGKQIFGFCFKVAFISNSIVSSAIIDLFSKCNRLEDSVQLFREQDRWDSALCNSMISSYKQHGFGDDAVQLFLLTMRKDLMPTEFTLSCLLSAVSKFFPSEQGSQIHSLVIKLGFELDAVVASSLVEMYTKIGSINDALIIFTNMGVRDLITWNTIMMGLTCNGRVSETMDIFEQLIREGTEPDRVTLCAVLLACNYGNFVDEGMIIFSSMENDFGIKPGEEHYAYIVEMLSRAGKLKEAMYVIETMPYAPSFIIWKSVICACSIHEDLRLTERLAKRMMEMEPQSSLPYLVLAQAYEVRGQWESMVRVRTAMKHKGVKEFTGYSWIGIKDHVYIFEADQLQHHGGKEIYLVLKLLVWEMEEAGYI
ncbi:Pentatricopeptide repeat [Quillaja saponaria]|uniref:Pentatricopeptide repeat n=1 Tax=Quillaja saponaria TaxID=32244 RepID=A0AAD7PSP6_QUISA|nr:Pentatricopeptide repeat [Quillaja saponaria]